MKNNLKKKIVDVAERESNFSSEIFLTREDIQRLRESIDNSRDKALIVTLWETGARLSELYNLRISDLNDWEHGIEVLIDGYTGKRKLPLIKSTPALKDWTKKHPENSNEKAYVWIDPEDEEKERVSYNYIRKLIKNAFENTGIEKISDVNHFRRSRAAVLANWLNEKEMKFWFGWQKESDLSGIMEGCSSCAGCPFSCKAR